MIPITIKDEKYKIKSIRELTTAEYIEVANIKNLDILSYVAKQVGIPEGEAFFVKYYKNLEKLIGTLEDVTKLPKSERFDYNKIIDLTGQRYQVESSNKTGFELFVYCLAVSQVRSTDSPKVQKMYDYYHTQPWHEILPAGFFFFKILQNGRSNAINISVKLKVLKKDIRIKFRLAYISLMHLPMSMKSRRCVKY